MNYMELLENEIDILKKYEDRLRTAYYSDYSRNVPSTDLNTLRNIYNKVMCTNYQFNMSCSTCQLNFLKRLGKWYFEVYKVVDETEPILNINELDKPVTNNEQITKKCPTSKTKKTTTRRQQKR